jgi:hypothetical protein
MSDNWEYKTTIKSQSFLFQETRNAARLILQGLNGDDVKHKSLQENIFQVETEARKKEIASTVLVRLRALDQFLMGKFVNSDIQTSKLIAIYSIMKTDRLFFEFMNEVYKDKIIIRDKFIMDKDFNIFFNRKKEQSDKVASWTDYTFYKLKQVITRILTEAGLITNKRGRRQILKPIVEDSIVDHLNEIGDTTYLNILIGRTD